MAKKSLTVHVYEADNEIRVFPPVLVADAGSGGGGNPGDDVEVVNNTSEDAVWFVPADALDANAIMMPVAKNGGKSGKKTATKKGSGNSRLVMYQVFMPQSGRKAKGHSDPLIIIEN